jgi:polyphosphate glucokinase
VVSGPRTLCVDLGGTIAKAMVLDHHGQPLSERRDQLTPYPLAPDDLGALVASLGRGLGDYERVALAFPGMVRDGRVVTAPHFVTEAGPGSAPSDALRGAWTDLDLEGSLGAQLGCPVRIGNDGDVHGLAVVAGQGVELVLILGSGCATGLFDHGRLCPHLELAHHPLAEGETYNEHLGDAARRRVGDDVWNGRVRFAIETLATLLNFDRLWIGGGNARHLTIDLPAEACLVGDDGGLLGGVRLWAQPQPSPRTEPRATTR